MRTVLPTFRCGASKEVRTLAFAQVGRTSSFVLLSYGTCQLCKLENSRSRRMRFFGVGGLRPSTTTGTFDYTTPARRRWSIFRVERCRQSGSLHFHHSSNNDSAQQYISRHNAGIVFFRNHAHNMLHVLPAPVPWPSQAGLRFCCTTRQCLVTTTLVVGGEIRRRGRRCCVRIE